MSGPTGRSADAIRPGSSVDGVGRFANGVGIFFADDTFEGKPIRVRGMFTPLTPRSMQWEQAFSPDGGRTWETNYVMHHTRIDA